MFTANNNTRLLNQPASGFNHQQQQQHQQQNSSGSGKDARLSPLVITPRTRTISSPSTTVDNNVSNLNNASLFSLSSSSLSRSTKSNEVSYDFQPLSAPVFSHSQQPTPFFCPSTSSTTSTSDLHHTTAHHSFSSPLNYDLNFGFFDTGNDSSSSNSGLIHQAPQNLSSANFNGFSSPSRLPSRFPQQSSFSPSFADNYRTYHHHAPSSSNFNQHSAALDYFHQHHLPYFLAQQQQQERQQLQNNQQQSSSNQKFAHRDSNFAPRATLIHPPNNLELPNEMYVRPQQLRRQQPSPFMASPSSMFSSLAPVSDADHHTHTTETILLTHKTETVINKLGQLSIQIQQLTVEASDLQWNFATDGSAWQRANLKLRLVDKALDQLRSTILLLDSSNSGGGGSGGQASNFADILMNNTNWLASSPPPTSRRLSLSADDNYLSDVFESSFFLSVTPPPSTYGSENFATKAADAAVYGKLASHHDWFATETVFSGENNDSINDYYDVDDHIVHECLLLTGDADPSKQQASSTSQITIESSEKQHEVLHKIAGRHTHGVSPAVKIESTKANIVEKSVEVKSKHKVLDNIANDATLNKQQSKVTVETPKSSNEPSKQPASTKKDIAVFIAPSTNIQTKSGAGETAKNRKPPTPCKMLVTNLPTPCVLTALRRVTEAAVGPVINLITTGGPGNTMTGSLIITFRETESAQKAYDRSHCKDKSLSPIWLINKKLRFTFLNAEEEAMYLEQRLLSSQPTKKAIKRMAKSAALAVANGEAVKQPVVFKNLQQQLEPNPYNVYLTSIPLYLSDDEIRQILEVYGRLEKIFIGPPNGTNASSTAASGGDPSVRNGGFAFVKFCSASVNQELVDQGYVVHGEDLIVVRPYVPRIANKKFSDMSKVAI